MPPKASAKGKKNDGAKIASAPPPLEPHDPTAEPELTAGALEVQERESAIGRLKSALGEFQDASAVLEIQTETLRDAVTVEREDADDVRDYLTVELVKAEAMVKTLAEQVAALEKRNRDQGSTFEALLRQTRETEEARVEAIQRKLEARDAEAETFRVREKERNETFAAIDAVSKTLANESRARRSEIARLEGEALSERAALARSHELILFERRLKLTQKTDEQMEGITKKAIMTNARRGDALAASRGEVERDAVAHETAARRARLAMTRRDATRETVAAAVRRSNRTVLEMEAARRDLAAVERDRREFRETNDRARRERSESNVEASKFEAEVREARLAFAAVVAQRDASVDRLARLAAAREKEAAEAQSARDKKRFSVETLLVDALAQSASRLGIDRETVLGVGGSSDDASTLARFAALDGMADALEVKLRIARKSRSARSLRSVRSLRSLRAVRSFRSVRSLRNLVPADASSALPRIASSALPGVATKLIPGDATAGTGDDPAHLEESHSEIPPRRATAFDPISETVRVLMGMPGSPKAKDLPPIPSFESRMSRLGVK